MASPYRPPAVARCPIIRDQRDRIRLRPPAIKLSTRRPSSPARRKRCRPDRQLHLSVGQSDRPCKRDKSAARHRYRPRLQSPRDRQCAFTASSFIGKNTPVSPTATCIVGRVPAIASPATCFLRFSNDRCRTPLQIGPRRSTIIMQQQQW